MLDEAEPGTTIGEPRLVQKCVRKRTIENQREVLGSRLRVDRGGDRLADAWKLSAVVREIVPDIQIMSCCDLMSDLCGEDFPPATGRQDSGQCVASEGTRRVVRQGVKRH